jgi:tryptophan-rich sensory protein
MDSYFMYLLIVAVAAGIASYFTMDGLTTSKYLDSKKPSWYPPSYLFSIMWTIIYLMFSYSWYLLSSYPKINMLYILNLFLNVLWCYLFFSLGTWDSALITLVSLNVVLLIQIVLTYKINIVGSLLLVPYFLWTCFASYLNYTMIDIN